MSQNCSYNLDVIKIKSSLVCANIKNAQSTDGDDYAAN